MTFIKNYLNEILLFICIILLCGLYLYIYFFNYIIDFKSLSDSENVIIENVISTSEQVEEEKNITVPEIQKYAEVKGCVDNPGVYSITDNTIIKDLLDIAKLNDNSYYNNINLSKKVKNEMVIYVYCISDYKSKNEKKEEVLEKCICEDYDISKCIDDNQSIIETSEANSIVEPTIESNNLININTATKEELMSLEGIGDAKANNIIEYRTLKGNFSSIEDIKNVSGISDTIYEKIKNNITV